MSHLAHYDYRADRLMRAGAHKKASAESIHAEVAKIGYVDILFLKAAPDDVKTGRISRCALIGLKKIESHEADRLLEAVLG